MCASSVVASSCLKSVVVVVESPVSAAFAAYLLPLPLPPYVSNSKYVPALPQPQP